MKSIFKKFLRKEKRSNEIDGSQNIITAPLSEEQIQAVHHRNQAFEPPQLIVGSGQSKGIQRDLNEDSLFTFSMTLANNTSSLPFGIFIIADGMGGYQYGEIASNVAIRTMASYLLKKFNPIIADGTASLDESLQEIMQAGVKEAQRAVLKAAPGSGTTLSAVLILGQQMTIAHIGDSRVYTIQMDGQVIPITRDHSMARRLEELGQITPDEAAVHPQKNVLYRALGQSDLLEADIFTAPFPISGYLFLCSDGLWGAVPETEIFKIISHAKNIQTACQELVDAANSAGGPDNISTILVQLLS
jgi:protein phosphatase